MAEEGKEIQKVSQAPAQPMAVAPAPIMGEEKKKVAAKRRPAKKADKTIVVKSKRKRSVARAYVRAGKGSVRINGMDVGAVEMEPIRNLILEPMNISEAAKEISKKMEIKVNVRGGGLSSQTQAIRGAIAKGIVAYSGSDSIKKEFLSYDRAMLVDDPRRVEPKKFKGPKARARFQTSYR